MISSFHQAQCKLFQAQGIATANLDSRLLICHACDLSHEQFVLLPERGFSEEQRSLLNEFQRRRLKGEPVSRIIGKREFWGREFTLGSETLDPRPDTESLIDAVLSHAYFKKDPPKRILDLGTGTGAILLTLLLEWPDAEGVGVDKSAQALQVAAKNAKKFGCDDRLSWLNGSWFEPVEGKFDLIISNPPYIVQNDIADLAVEVAQYDPILALDGGKNGLCAYQDIVKDIYQYLEPQGMIAFELGKGQYEDVKQLLMAGKGRFQLESFGKYNDLAGVERCILVQLEY